MKSTSAADRILAAATVSRGTKKPRLGLTIQFATGEKPLPRSAEIRAWAKGALARDAEITMRFVDEAEASRLNREFRGRDHATNVLTFAYDNAAPLSGDIVFCAPVVAREAAEQGKALASHYAHLVIHGLLHLQGYDHEREADAAEMEAIEKTILRRLGFPDPYA
jgi:probable rRNA maturation factor